MKQFPLSGDIPSFPSLRRLSRRPHLSLVAALAAAAVFILSPRAPAATGPLTGVVKTVYPNGLVLLSKEVHAAPIASVFVYYRVGSRDETQGLFGISHQIEHMMFKGTARMQPGEIDRLISQRGGENNAFTTQDYTGYEETVPSSALNVVLGIEADRMENSLMAPLQLRHENLVVLSELEGDLNSPATNLYDAVVGAAIVAHPYHNPIIGYENDVRRFTDAEVKHYYYNFYAPNNAVLVVVGDFQTATLRREVGAYFEQDVRRPIQTHAITYEVPQSGERRVNVNGVGNNAYVEMAYHVPRTGATDHYVMDVISTILAESGQSSRLFRALVERGLATEVDAGDPDMKDPFLMLISATVANGHTQQEVENAINAELDRLKSEPVTPQELQKTINQVKASFIYQNDSVSDQARELGFRAILGDYRYDASYLAHIEKVTPADIQAAARRYFTRANSTVGWFIPRAPRPGEIVPSGVGGGPVHYRPAAESVSPIDKPWARPARLVSARTLPSLYPARFRPGLHPAPAPVYMAARPATHKATVPQAAGQKPRPLMQRPKIGANPPLSHPPVFRTVLPNGMVVIIYPNHSNPDVSISGSLRAGALVDPPGKAGLANFTAYMLSRGTSNRTEDQIGSQLDFAAANANVTAGESGTFYSAHCLDESLPLVLDILSDELRHPSFPTEAFNRVKNELETAIQQMQTDPGTVAQHQFFAALYPDSYPLHWPMIGTTDTVQSITIGDLKAFHDQYYRPDLATIAIVGDVKPASALALVQQYFGSWTASGPRPDTVPPSLATQIPARKVVTTMPDKSEAIVFMGFRGISRRNPHFYAATLMNLILGSGDFNSLLMKDIRDRKGLTYGVFSSFDATVFAGPWFLQMQVNPPNVDRAVASAVIDIRQMHNAGPSPKSIALFKNWVTGNQALQLATDAGIAESLMMADYYGLGMNYPWQYAHHIRAVTPAQLKDAAHRFLHPDHLFISIAGPYPYPPAR